jgi:hypothetical protein
VTAVPRSPQAQRFYSSPQARQYQSAHRPYSLSAGSRYQTRLTPLQRDSYYGNLRYGSGYHYGRYDYYPVYGANNLLVYILLADALGNQRRVNCDNPTTQTDYDACTSARAQLTRASGDWSTTQPQATVVREKNGLGIWAALGIAAFAAAVLGLLVALVLRR